MGREVRRVPGDWVHPKDSDGRHVPMHETLPEYTQEEIEEAMRAGWMNKYLPNYGIPVMPDWPSEQRTHWQMYENTTEGTPISPPMQSPEALAKWLVDNRASAFADLTATYELWLATIEAGYAPSLVIDANGLRSGVGE